ncbi:hypothetical protein [Acetobacter okinawensis]|uniref:hypothetical protein n=1 Tax=Acetobacter okinawensis TaxID=1076594 RepID=UPI0038CF9481
MTQNEFDALVSRIYNSGEGGPGIRAAIKAATSSRPSGSSRSRCARKARFMNSLVKRRHDEVILLLDGRY